MILLGVDYGTKRIGLATGDTEVSFAFPLRTLAVVDAGVAALAVADIARQERADIVVVGMPYRMTGTGDEGDTEVAVNAFVAALKEVVDIPVETEDERFTSAVADRLRSEAGISAKKFDRDAAAAAAILETYMVRRKKV